MSGRPRSVAIVGAGPAGLMAAEVIAAAGVPVTVYDRMPSAGRKFLLAGRGGLNLTHTEPLPTFMSRYREARSWLQSAIERFPPDATRTWCEGLGQPTFVGSSGRVFPVAMKASPVLRAWLARLSATGVRFAFRHRWTGWDEAGGLVFETLGGPVKVDAGAAVLAMGGASWPRLGSDATWVDSLRAAADIAVSPLRPANCGFTVDWTPSFRARFEGTPLKNVAMRFGDATARGDAMVSHDGLEGGAIYALAAAIRHAMDGRGAVRLLVALRPDLAPADIARRLSNRRPKESLSTALRRVLRLAPVAVGLLHEACQHGNKPLAALDPGALAALINAVPLTLVRPFSLDRAISTAGGVEHAAFDTNLMLKRLPGTFVAGEMLDWEAPTGGYLLQACLATGAMAGRGALQWLDKNALTSAEAEVDQYAEQAQADDRIS